MAPNAGDISASAVENIADDPLVASRTTTIIGLSGSSCCMLVLRRRIRASFHLMIWPQNMAPKRAPSSTNLISEVALLCKPAELCKGHISTPSLRNADGTHAKRLCHGESVVLALPGRFMMAPMLLIIDGTCLGLAATISASTAKASEHTTHHRFPMIKLTAAGCIP